MLRVCFKLACLYHLDDQDNIELGAYTVLGFSAAWQAESPFRLYMH